MASAHQSVVEMYQAIMVSLRSDPSFVAVLRSAVTDWESLSKNEQTLVHLHLSAHLWHCQNAFALANQGILDPELYRAYEDFNVSMLRCPGFAQWYAAHEQHLPPNFVQRIRERLSDPSTLPPPMHEALSFWAD